jgi:hypothetical protein
LMVPDLNQAHQDGILRAAKACLIHNTLINAPAIETVVRTSHDTIGVGAELAEATRN